MKHNGPVNENHKKCGSDEWRAVVRDSIIPWALGDVELGDDVLEFPDGRFSGAASFTMLHHLPTAALQDRLFAEVARVLHTGGAFVLGDSLASEELAAHHEGDTYNPVDPDGLAERLEAAGFADVEVKTNPFGWAGLARRS